MKSFLSKIGEFFENIWYHYKWLILIILVVGTLVVVSVVQISEKGDPDVHVMFIGQNYITAEGRKEVEKSLKKIIDDYNGDGKVSMDLVELTVTTVPGESYDYDYQHDALTRFETELRAGMSTVFIVEESFYARILELGLAAPLEKVFGKENVPNYKNDDYSFRMRDLDVAEESGFNRFPRESIVCIRHSPENDEINYSRTMEDYENNLDFFKKFVSYKSGFVMNRPTVGILHVDETMLLPLSIHRLDDGVYYTWKEMKDSDVAHVDYKSIQIKKDKDGNVGESHLVQMEEALKSGKYGIVFMDSSCVEYAASKGLLTNTSEIFADFDKMKDVTDYGVYYDNLTIRSITGFYYMNGATTEEHSMVIALPSAECFDSEETYKAYREYYKHLICFEIPTVENQK